MLPKAPQSTTITFITPAGQVDFPDDPANQAALNAQWNTNLQGFTAQAITGNPAPCLCQDHSTPSR